MPDYMYQLESRLSAEQRAALMRIQELAIAGELNLYLTGGAVRDMISGMPIRDLDFTVEGNPAKIAKELEKGGARIVSEDDTLRTFELALAGDVDVSVSAAREDVYSRPGAKLEVRFSTIMEDLKRRDFSINAIAISLNANSKGLLLDPTNGLADLDRREIRALSIHSFTNQPVRLLRAQRYAARMGFKIDTRTNDWFHLALERKLQDTVSAADAGSELRQAAREEKPVAVLKAWEGNGLLEPLFPVLAKRHPDYEAINRITKVREDMTAAGLRVRLVAPVTLAILGRLNERERAAILSRISSGAAEQRAVEGLEGESQKVAKTLTGPKTASVPDAYAFLENTSLDSLGYILAESSNAKAVAKIRNYLSKWKPIRQALPAVAIELETLGMERGPKFDKVLEDFFHLQLLGRARKPEDHVKILRKLSGIKEQLKKVEEKKKPEKGKKKGGPPSVPEAVAAVSAPPKGTKPKVAVAAPPPAKAAPPKAEVPAAKEKPAAKAAEKPKPSARKK